MGELLHLLGGDMAHCNLIVLFIASIYKTFHCLHLQNFSLPPYTKIISSNAYTLQYTVVVWPLLHQGKIPVVWQPRAWSGWAGRTVPGFPLPATAGTGRGQQGQASHHFSWLGGSVLASWMPHNNIAPHEGGIKQPGKGDGARLMLGWELIAPCTTLPDRVMAQEWQGYAPPISLWLQCPYKSVHILLGKTKALQHLVKWGRGVWERAEQKKRHQSVPSSQKSITWISVTCW